MESTNKFRTRGTNVDLVFDYLCEEINSLRLLPGAKISEADIAAQFGFSRQPVRDAFSRLENLDLVLIQPKKATEVRKFSTHAVTKSRFIRHSIEVEVLRRAVKQCDVKGKKLLESCLRRQRKVVADDDLPEFHTEDYIFHKSICEIAGTPYAFEVISDEKAKVDRLCSLSLTGTNRLSQLLEDHEQIAAHVIEGNTKKAVSAGTTHLARLDETINNILQKHPEYFED